MSNGADHSFPDRARFMAYAARVMRGLILDYARARNSAKKVAAIPSLRSPWITWKTRSIPGSSLDQWRTGGAGHG